METVTIPINKTLGRNTRARKFKKILLIDPDKTNALSGALTRTGYDLVQCDSVQQAWNFVYPRRPDLIVLRLNNAHRAVLSEFRECRVLAASTPIVLALSAPAKPGLVEAMQRRSSAILLVSPTVESVTGTLDDLERKADDRRSLWSNPRFHSEEK
jgi:DNA-binding NtrC family response regulator